jgi:DNA repair exonuclease SbcCD ATPase subunit
MKLRWEVEAERDTLAQRVKELEQELDTIKRMAATGTVQNILDMPRDKLAEFTAQGIRESTARKELEADKRELVEALEKHGAHMISSPLCEHAKHNDNPCTCGLDAALAKHKGEG